MSSSSARCPPQSNSAPLLNRGQTIADICGAMEVSAPDWHRQQSFLQDALWCRDVDHSSILWSGASREELHRRTRADQPAFVRHQACQGVAWPVTQ